MVLVSLVSTDTDMGWGYYGLAYTQSDSDGDTAVCTFLLDNRRKSSAGFSLLWIHGHLGAIS